MFESTAHQSLFKAKSCTTRFGIIFTRKAKTIYMSIPLGATTSTESNDQRQVSICLIFIYCRFSVQFVTPTSQFTPFESNGLVYKPHPRFLTQNFGKKARLIHEFLRYILCTIRSEIYRTYIKKLLTRFSVVCYGFPALSTYFPVSVRIDAEAR